MSNPLDDPTCHECPIAQSIRAERDELRERENDYLAEIARLKGTNVGVQRVSHGARADDPK